MRLRAAKVWVEHNERVARVAFADRDDATSTYVLMTRDLMTSEINRRLGMDGVYLEINHQSCAAYRAASFHRLEDHGLRVVVSQAALGKLGLTGDLWIELADPDMDIDKLRAALAAMFETES